MNIASTTVEHSMIFVMFLIFSGAAILSTFAILTRQSMLVAYMLLGILLGPWLLNMVNNPGLIRSIGDIGIVFLLFLLGLNLPPQKLILMLKKVSWVGFISSLIFIAVGYLVAYLFGYSSMDCLIVGAAMMFSSTIIGIKLLPTTILHHQHTGEVMISILLLQDLLAIIVLLLLHALTIGGVLSKDILMVSVGFPVVLVFSYLFERYILRWLFSKFNRIKEYLFLVAIGWCLAMAQLADYLGLSVEIGAFIAGVSIAASPISLYIAESLKPLRDFFLVMFFFSVGASFNLHYLPDVIVPALILAALFMLIKPVTYRFLLGQVNETKQVSWEVGTRLAQISEFSLIIAYVGLDSKLLSQSAGYLIQAATILSFVVSSYWVVMRYPTPMALSDRLRRD
jgi:Kef-type K+ transport system membrane component KefB